jgi:hypothetical protein
MHQSTPLLTSLPVRGRNARRLRFFKGLFGGRSRSQDERMAVNLSFVLHEVSTSETVRRAVEISTRHKPACTQLVHIHNDGDPALDVDLWFAPSIGTPSSIASALETETPVWQVDQGTGSTRIVSFFGAPAELTLPDSEPREVGIAALVTRPGRTSALLITRGPFSWPVQELEVLGALETIIQAHAEQWQPGAQLWTAAAETMLDENLHGH